MVGADTLPARISGDGAGAIGGRVEPSAPSPPPSGGMGNAGMGNS